MRPTTIQERVREIDVLRGIALFGILAANMRGFNSPAEVYTRPSLMWTAPADQIAQALIDCFISGKFISLFAALFGLGFAVQLDRAEARSESFGSIYVRRLTGLMLFGAIHAFLFWWGDILLSYAAVGFFLLLFRDRPQSSVMLWAMILYWFPILLMGGAMIAALAGASHGTFSPQIAPEALERTIRIYAEGSFVEMLRERMREWVSFNSTAPFSLSRILSLFLLGLYVWRMGVFQNLDSHLPAIRRITKRALWVGLAGNVCFILVHQFLQADLMQPTPAALAAWLAAFIGVPALSLFYAGGVILLYQRSEWRRRLTPFAAVGRMALTNYLLQSILCTTLYNSYGSGLFGKVGPLLGLLPAVLIYAAQVVFSEAWLRRFRFGPAEWLWRSMTYGELQTMRKEAA